MSENICNKYNRYIFISRCISLADSCCFQIPLEQSCKNKRNREKYLVNRGWDLTYMKKKKRMKFLIKIIYSPQVVTGVHDYQRSERKFFCDVGVLLIQDGVRSSKIKQQLLNN